MASNLYRAPDIAPANVKMVAEISDHLGLEIPESDLQDYVDQINEALATVEMINSIPQPTPEVAYPRTPGYRPDAKENPYNAWYMKTDIKGAPSGILAGKTFAIKDSVCVAGVPMMNGSPLIEGHIPDYDATVVTRILKAGGTIAGKAVCENLCYSGSSFTASTGPVLNPHDPTRSAGGSSNGSAVLVANGDVDMAIGGDQGGSIRLPSSWCGIVGMKATFTLVPYTGGIHMYPLIDNIGPMARTVRDCATLLQVIAGPDPWDPRQKSNLQVPNFLENLEKGVKGVKIAILKEGFEMCTQEEVKTIVKAAVDKLVNLGCSVNEVSVPYHITLTPGLFACILSTGIAESTKDGGVLPGVGGWHDIKFMKHFKQSLAAQAKDLSPIVKRVLTLAKIMKRQDNFLTFAKAENLIPVFRKAYDDVFENYDVIIMPTTPFVAMELPKRGPMSIKEYERHAISNTPNTAPFNLTGHPALTINAGFTEKEKLPVGMMIVGKHSDDALVLRVARAFEKARDGK